MWIFSSLAEAVVTSLITINFLLMTGTGKVGPYSDTPLAKAQTRTSVNVVARYTVIKYTPGPGIGAVNVHLEMSEICQYPAYGTGGFPLIQVFPL